MEQSQQIKIAIVGGGPAGIFCALNLIKNFSEISFADYNISIFDKAPVLRTILPTGNLRCNITNSIYDIKEFASNYPRGEKFLYSIFSRYSNYDTLDFFKSIGIETYCQEDGRIFPKTNSSKDVKEKMLNSLFSSKKAKLINKEIKTKNDLIGFDFIVLACGSKGTEKIIKSFNHKCIDFKPALCSLICDFSFDLQGVSLKTSNGDFVFTKDGLSGPLAFKISSLNAYSTFPYDVSIKLFSEEEIIDFAKNNPRKSLSELFLKKYPKSFSKAFLGEFYLKNSCEISKENLKRLSKFDFKVLSHSLKGEIVNAGGVDLAELDKNCKSKINDNLWFCGEIMNIDGFCGGFNLQNCWSSAYIVALDLKNKIIS